MQNKQNQPANKFTAKPFVKWVGGKGQLIRTLENKLPDKLVTLDSFTYIEPFVGGGAMLFFMLQKYPNISKAVINDMNPYLITAYRTIRDTPEKLITALSEIQQEYLKLPNDEQRKDFYLYVRKLFNSKELTAIDRSTYLIFLNKTCFNGLYRENLKGAFNVPFGKYKNPLICDEKTIYADSELLQNVEIKCGDFGLTTDYISDNTFLYIDPPYRPINETSSFNTYVKGGFDDKEQIRLKNFADVLSSRGCFFMISNSDCKNNNPDDTFFDDLYKDYLIERVYASRSVNAKADKRGKLTELLIRNYANTVNSLNLSKQIKEINLNNNIYAPSTHKRTV